MSHHETPNLSILGQDNSHLFQGNTSTQTGTERQLPASLATHKGMTRVFQPGKLTLGLIAPFKGYPDSAIPDVQDLGELAVLAEQLGFAALWIRDVPFYDPSFGDVGQGLDPWTTLGYLAAQTRDIALGTAGIVSPLRNPYHTAKSAVSTDALSQGRFLLGLSSGDRPVEYPIFQQDFENRAERFREAWRIMRTLTSPGNGKFPVIQSRHYGPMEGHVDVVPKPQSPLPMLAIGRARQELDWLANTADAWIWHGVKPTDTQNIVQTLAKLNQDGAWHPFGYANFVDLSEDRDEPASLWHNIFLRGGSRSLLEFWAEQKEKGLSHVTINLKPSRRPAEEVLQELSEDVLAKVN